MIHLALIAALAPGIASGQAASAPAYTRSQAEQDLRGVIETFRTSIIRKDKAAFLALFHDAPVVWQGVDSDALVAKSGRRAGVMQRPHSTPLKIPAPSSRVSLTRRAIARRGLAMSPSTRMAMSPRSRLTSSIC